VFFERDERWDHFGVLLMICMIWMIWMKGVKVVKDADGIDFLEPTWFLEGSFGGKIEEL
jgi:hypothetical protein